MTGSLNTIYIVSTICLTVCHFLISAPVALAAPTFSLHMSYRDVLSAAGPAAEKRDMESRREQLWLYPDGSRLLFKEGRLISGPGVGTGNKPELEVSQRRPVFKPALGEGAVISLPPAQPQRAARVAGLLRDIMKTIPSSDEAASTVPGKPGRQPQMRTPPYSPVKRIEQDDFEEREDE